MSSDRIADRLDDIVLNIDRISGHLESVDQVQFATDLLVYDAVERCLERICEAVAQLTRLGLELERLEPTVPWGDIRGLGNRLRHGYFAMDSDRLWVTATRDLAPSRAAATRLQVGD